MPSKKEPSARRSNRPSNTGAESISKASSSVQNALLQPELAHNITPSYESSISHPPGPSSDQDVPQEWGIPSADLNDFGNLNQAMIDHSILLDQLKQPSKRKPPVKRKAATTSTTEKRVTRARKSKTSLAATVFKASPLARAHLMSSNPGSPHYASNGKASTTEQGGASSNQFDIPIDPTLQMIPPMPESVPASTILRRHTFPGCNSVPATSVGQEPYYQAPTSAHQASPNKTLTPWFSLDTAPTLPLPSHQYTQFSPHPLSPLNRCLSHSLPQNLTAIDPLPHGHPLSLTPSPPPLQSLDPDSLDGDNFIRSIVTYRRLGLRFDDIAARFHLAGFAADVVTAPAVEHIWREAEQKDFPPWYDVGVQKLRVFERDDPDYL
ncbi:MAG: hypothetical protein Q9213_001944 [Squamulea squamosa]